MHSIHLEQSHVFQKRETWRKQAKLDIVLIRLTTRAAVEKERNSRNLFIMTNWWLLGNSIWCHDLNGVIVSSTQITFIGIFCCSCKLFGVGLSYLAR